MGGLQRARAKRLPRSGRSRREKITLTVLVGHPLYKGAPSVFALAVSILTFTGDARAAWSTGVATCARQFFFSPFYSFHAEKSKLIPALCPRSVYETLSQVSAFARAASANVARCSKREAPARHARKIIAPPRSNVVSQHDDVRSRGGGSEASCISRLFPPRCLRNSPLLRRTARTYEIQRSVCAREPPGYGATVISANDLHFTAADSYIRTRGALGHTRMSEVQNELSQ